MSRLGCRPCLGVLFTLPWVLEGWLSTVRVCTTPQPPLCNPTMSLVQYLSVLVDECAGDYSGIAGFRFSSKSNIETQLHPRLRSFIGQVSEVVVASGANPIPPAARQQCVFPGRLGIG